MKKKNFDIIKSFSNTKRKKNRKNKELFLDMLLPLYLLRWKKRKKMISLEFLIITAIKKYIYLKNAPNHKKIILQKSNSYFSNFYISNYKQKRFIIYFLYLIPGLYLSLTN